MPLGVMRWLDEQNIGYPVGAAGVVPIVPAAILFDLGFGGSPKIRPTADCGYRAAGPPAKRRCRKATSAPAPARPSASPAAAAATADR